MAKISNQVLRDLVIELREDKGLTFQEISDELQDKYGVTRTRQAISGIYNRAKNSSKLSTDTQRLKSDIVNIYCLLGNATDVHEQLSKFRSDVNYRYILRVIKSEELYINSIKTTIIANIATKLMDGVTDIKELSIIEYKSIPISDKVFKEYFELACEYALREMLTSNLARIYSINGDIQLVRSLASKFNIPITKGLLRGLGVL